MDYCGPRSVPYSHFLGGSNQWDDLSRSAALAWHADQRSACASCGTYRDEWFDSDGVELRDLPYEVVARNCAGCELLEDWHEEHKDAKRSMHLSLRPVPDDEGASSPEGGGVPTVTG